MGFFKKVLFAVISSLTLYRKCMSLPLKRGDRPTAPTPFPTPLYPQFPAFLIGHTGPLIWPIVLGGISSDHGPRVSVQTSCRLCSQATGDVMPRPSSRKAEQGQGPCCGSDRQQLPSLQSLTFYCYQEVHICSIKFHWRNIA